jgi:hypothetical protein
MNEDQLLRRIRVDTHPTEGSVSRVHDRAMAAARKAQGLLDAVPGPESGATQRVKAKLLRPRAPARRPVPWVPLALLGAAAAAAALFLSPPSLDPTVPAAELGAEAVVQLTPEVALDIAGTGVVEGGTRRAPVVSWTSGTLVSEVMPDQGVRFVVRTPEAEVTVLGTRFEVDRGPLGTTVSVTRGKVRVACSTGQETVLTAGDDHTCIPTDGRHLLGRANELVRLGAETAVVDAAIQQGLAVAEPFARGELLHLQLGVALDAGDEARALGIAQRYLDEGHETRVDEVQEVALELDRRERCRNGEDAACAR